MNRHVLSCILGTLLCGTCYATPNLVLKLNKINFQIDRAEIFAANCAVEVKESQTMELNCSQATDLLKKLDRKLDYVEGLNFNKNDEIAQNIKQLRSKLAQVHQELTNATVATDNSNSPFVVSN